MKIPKLTAREIILFRVALKWYKNYDDSNPDVGMGSSKWGLLDNLKKQTGIEISEEDVKIIIGSSVGRASG